MSVFIKRRWLSNKRVMKWHMRAGNMMQWIPPIGLWLQNSNAAGIGR